MSAIETFDCIVVSSQKIYVVLLTRDFLKKSKVLSKIALIGFNKTNAVHYNNVGVSIHHYRRAPDEKAAISKELSSSSITYNVTDGSI